jgi:hypothetical protein
MDLCFVWQGALSSKVKSWQPAWAGNVADVLDMLLHSGQLHRLDGKGLCALACCSPVDLHSSATSL